MRCAAIVRLCLAAGAPAATASALAAQAPQPLTAAAPEIFAPGRVSGPANDGGPAFSPDGMTLYFGRAGASWGFVMGSHRQGRLWSVPVVAPFSGLWSDSQPAMSPDGATLIFQSWRPDATATTPATPVSALWRVRRTSGGWSAPERLPATINLSPRIFKPTIAANGNLYFMAKTDDKATWQLYRSEYRNGEYLKAAPLPFSDGAHGDVDPEIAPDESFIIFSSNARAAAADSHEHLYISFRADSGWGAIEPLRYAGDYEHNPADDGEAHLGVDHRTLYFTSGRANPIRPNRTRAQAAEDFAKVNAWDNGNNNVWSISLAPWLEEHKAHS